MILRELAEAVEGSDVARINEMKETVKNYDDPWQIHLSLFPAVQRVLNPPFINPHLPKMYNICRDFVPYLSKAGVGSLVYLELMEYARRTKLEEVTPKPPFPSRVSFADVEKSIAEKDRGKATLLLRAFLEQGGQKELVRRLLLLGSGYLNQSLGHSVSCTAFILLELVERPGIDATPTLFLLADYFCKGGFHTTPPLTAAPVTASITDHLSRASTGTGFVDLHHTITLFAIERTRSFLTPKEQGHMIAAWLEFMGDKQAKPRGFPSGGKSGDYDRFYESFSQLDVDGVLEASRGMIDSPRQSQLCTSLVTGVCDLYQGNYDPHYLTGLGSLLWVMNIFRRNADLVQNALYQYLTFFFRNLKSED